MKSKLIIQRQIFSNRKFQWCNFSSIIEKPKINVQDIPTLKEFLLSHKSSHAEPKHSHNQSVEHSVNNEFEYDDNAIKSMINSNNNILNISLKFYIETYGCQMNLSDTEIIRSILIQGGHIETVNIDETDVILTNTCAIRENAENKVHHRLIFFQSLRSKSANKKIRKAGYPLVGVLGCMAERLKTKLLEDSKVDFVCGPDSYRDMPRLIESVILTNEKMANVQLSLEETYADITPTRAIVTHTPDKDSPDAVATSTSEMTRSSNMSAFVSIMRGCNNMCSFCIVPFTRGRERSRSYKSIIAEIDDLVQRQGMKEVVLLGQNVNGYHDPTQTDVLYSGYRSTPGFNNLYQSKTKSVDG